jgi:hypothetical protein
MSQDSTAKKPPAWVTDGFKPGDAFDVSDENPQVIAEHLRALQREMREGFDLVMSALGRITKTIEGDHVRDSDIEQRVAALEQPKRKASRK